MNSEKEVYIIGGPNGAGKTTFVTRYLPQYLDIRNFVNADHIAFGLSPLDVSRLQIKAGKVMLELLADLQRRGESFGFETTLAGRKWLKVIESLKADGYVVHVFFLNIIDVELCVRRVENRVKSGGHDIPEDVIRRRYVRARSNFWNMYKEAADFWYLFDASTDEPQLVASKNEIIDDEYLQNYWRI